MTTLQDVLQVSDGNQIETYVIGTGGLYTYRLGDNASPALPAGWARSIKGSLAVPVPSAPTIGAEVADANALANGATYKWAMSIVTPNGESALSSQATHTMTQAAGQTLTLPLATSIATNRAIGRRLYRTRAGGSSLFRVVDIPTVASLTLVDTMPDNHLILPAPVADSSAVASGIVSVTGTIGGTPTTFVETLATTPSSGQYNVDRTNGILKFAAADAGVTVTITYTAASRVEKHLLNDIIDTINSITPAGQDGFSDGQNDRTGVVANAGVWTSMPSFGGSWTAKGGRIVLFASFLCHVASGTLDTIYFSFNVNGTVTGSSSYGQSRMRLAEGTTQRITMMGFAGPISGVMNHNIVVNPDTNLTLDFYSINHGAWEIPA